MWAFAITWRPSTIHILIFSSETTGSIGTKFCRNCCWMVPFQNCIRYRGLLSITATVAKNRKRGMTFKTIFSSETARPFSAKLWLNGLWMIPFQNGIWLPGLPIKIAATAKFSLTWDPMGNSLIYLFNWNCLAYWNQTLMEWSLGGHLSKLCPAVPTSKQYGRHNRT